MPQIVKTVLNNGTANVDFQPMRCNGSGNASFRDETSGQDNLKDLFHVSSTTNSNSTRKTRVDLIVRKTRVVDGVAEPFGTANVTIELSIPSTFDAADKTRVFNLGKSLFNDAQMVSVLRDGQVLY